jgi:hypothetical protein
MNIDLLFDIEIPIMVIEPVAQKNRVVDRKLLYHLIASNK